MKTVCVIESLMTHDMMLNGNSVAGVCQKRIGLIGSFKNLSEYQCGD